jgi:EAL domain-containing protein (putative c-di-GMP-specific phosphodiesterase class I)/PAS domain-containing protein
MANGLTSFRVLITAAEAQAAEALLRVLHRARLPARGMFTQHPRRLAQLVAEHGCDLIIVHLSDGAAPDQVLSGYRKLETPLPLVVVHDAEASSDHLLALLRAGATAMVAAGGDGALVAAVRHALEDDAPSARVEQLGARVDAVSQALRHMAMQADAPAAYLCGGRIADANAAFRRLFQAPGDDELGDRSFSELAVAEHRARVDELLAAEVLAGAHLAAPEPVCFVDAHGQARDCRLIMQSNGRDDDDCSYVLLKPDALEGGPAGEPTPPPETESAAAAESEGVAQTLHETAVVVEPAVDPGDDDWTAEPAAPQGDDAEAESIEAKIERALSEDSFQIMYQPIVSLLGDSQETYSVLLRLEDINKLILTAAQLLGPAARTGNLPAIDRWVIGHALRDLSARRKSGQRIGFFLSLSAETVKDANLLIWICDTLREYDARGGWVIFQIQERDAGAQLEQWIPLAQGLKKIKSRIAINQFGHEPNPERLLERAPPDFVKFAPDFALDLADDAEKQDRLAKLTRLARSYGAKTIVTGVEDARALTVLWGAGIDYVQGNFLQGPSASLDPPR